MALLPSREQLRALTLRYVEVPGARALHGLGLSPNVVTLLGFLVSAGAAALVAVGYPLIGGIVFLAGGILDLLDGALARLTGQTSRFGALLDSVMDRLGEAALFLGIAIYFVLADLSDGRLLFGVIVLLLALIASQGVSYLRARGESLGIDSRSGLMTRPERVVLLSLGLALGHRPLEVILTVIASISMFTLLQRLFHIRGELDKNPEQPLGVDKGIDPL